MNRLAREPRPTDRASYITAHALERFHEHHPAATRRDLCLAIAYGVGVSNEMACSLLGRPLELNRGDTVYILAEDRRGLFALREGCSVVVTYLRFGPRQEDFARTHWPERVERVERHR